MTHNPADAFLVQPFTAPFDFVWHDKITPVESFVHQSNRGVQPIGRQQANSFDFSRIEFTLFKRDIEPFLMGLGILGRIKPENLIKVIDRSKKTFVHRRVDFKHDAIKFLE